MSSGFVSFNSVAEDLDEHPGKKLFWQSGLTWKGAEEYEISRNPKDYPKKKLVCIDLCMQERTINSWKDDLEAKFDWACVVELVRNTDEEMHLKGLSSNDMY